MRFYIRIPNYLLLTAFVLLVGVSRSLNPPSPEKLYANPETTEEFLSRGTLYLKRRDYEKALADFIQAEKLDPQNRSVYLKQGSALSALNRPAEAIEQYEKSKALSEYGGDLIQLSIDREREKLQAQQAE